MSRHDEGSLVRGLGPIATTALVAGNIIGSGIFVIPASLAAEAGPCSLLAWPIVALAYWCLTYVYTDLAQAYPVTGGMQAYVQRALGDRAGFMAAFMYWISCLTSNAAFVTAFVGYFRLFFPSLTTPLEQFLVAQLLLWVVTGINIVGVKWGGATQTTTVILKVIPLLVLSLGLLTMADTSNLSPWVVAGKEQPIFVSISLIAWLFLGAESVTVPAGEIKDAGRTIRRAAFIGFGLATLVYFLVALSLALAFPNRELIGNVAPLAYAAERLVGPLGGQLIAVVALISILGVLNGWLLVTGRLPYAAATMGVAPARLGRLHPRFHTPAISLAISSALTGILLLSYFSQTLLEAYNTIALAATATALVTVGMTCLSHLILTRREPTRFSRRQRRSGTVLAVIGVFVVILMIYGSERPVIKGTFACMAISLLLYPLLGRARKSPTLRHTPGD
jgi:APA family basic amino acid/polyamine antiporter